VSPAELAALIAASGGLGAALAAVVTKYMSRGTDTATAEKLRAESREAAQRTASAEVQTLLTIIQEVRAAEAAKSQRIEDLERRIEQLEERERHALTRAAVHEAWDQMAFTALTRAGTDPPFPSPPPLRHDEQLSQHRR
jgi:hypothetical protein